MDYVLWATTPNSNLPTAQTSSNPENLVLWAKKYQNSEMSLGDDSEEEGMPASLEDNYVNVDTDENGETQAARMPFSNNVLATNKSFW